MFRTPTARLARKASCRSRHRPETADSILLYAGRRTSSSSMPTPSAFFAATAGSATDATMRKCVRSSSPVFRGDVSRYNEFHALLVNVGKNWCRPRDPRCGECPLGPVSRGSAEVSKPKAGRAIYGSRSAASCLVGACRDRSSLSARSMLPFTRRAGSELIILYALYTFIVHRLSGFRADPYAPSFVSGSNIEPGSSARASRPRWCLGAMGISLLPVVFLFFISYALMNRTLNRLVPQAPRDRE